VGDLAWWTLAACGAVLLIGAVATARRPARELPGRAEHVRQWSAAHGGFDPGANVLVTRWLGVMASIAVVPARLGVSPNVLTLVGIWCAGVAAAVAGEGGHWVGFAALLVAANGVFDGLDGAVAILTGRVGHRGRLIDSAADRISDGLLLLALVRCADAVVPGVVAAGVAAVAILGLEGTRARLLAGGYLGRLTPGERPTRLILTGLGLIAAGAVPRHADAIASITLVAIAAVAGASWVLVLGELSRRPGR
jgi:phosphatidylglycerophosphate synthase